MNDWESFTMEIWYSREHVCQCCGIPLSYPIKTYYFSHVLSRGAWPIAKYWKENILLMCFDCHQQWDNETYNQDIFEGVILMEKVLIKTASYLQTIQNLN